MVAGPPQVITRASAFAPRRAIVATASSHTNALPVPGRTRSYTQTTRPRRPDERPEFHRDVLEVLRQPLAKGVVTIARVLAGIILIPHPLSYRPCFLALKSNTKPTKRLHLHARETPDEPTISPPSRYTLRHATK